MIKAREVSIKNKQFMLADFWDYAVHTYSLHGVQDACLYVQDNYGMDVNMLLLCSWLDKQKVSLTKDGLHALHAASQHWQNTVLHPFRAKRRALNKKTDAYRAHLKQELLLEKDEQQALLQALQQSGHTPCNQHTTSPENTVRYCILMNVPDEHIQPLLKAIHD